MNTHDESAPAQGLPGPSTSALGLLGSSALALALAETAAGLVLGARGLWPDGRGPWLLLIASALVALGARPRRRRPASPGRQGPGSAAHFGLAVLGIGCASAVAGWAGTWVAAVALLVRASQSHRPGSLFGPVLFALARAGTFSLGFVYATGSPLLAPAPGLLILAGLYGTLAFSTSRIAHLAAVGELTPSKHPLHLLALGSWALIAVPFVPFLPASHLLARAIALGSIALGAPGYFRLGRRRRHWNRRAVATATIAGHHCLLLFTATAALLSWTYTTVTIFALTLAGAQLTGFLSRRWCAIVDEAEDDRPATANLQAGLAHLEHSLVPAAEASPAQVDSQHEEELARTREELAQVRAQLEQVLAEGSTGSSNTELLERRIQKLLGMVHRTEDELRRVAGMKAGDPGLSSIYRGVQGLSEVDELHGQKSELLGAIFEANLELRRLSQDPEEGLKALPGPKP